LPPTAASTSLGKYDQEAKQCTEDDDVGEFEWCPLVERQEQGVYTFGEYTITIPEIALEPVASLLATMQARAIERGILQEVSTATQVHTLGRLSLEPRVVCVMVNLPQNFMEKLKDLVAFPLSFVKLGGITKVGTILVHQGTDLSEDERQMQFSDLDASYEFILHR
jgi:hypothetical protein